MMEELYTKLFVSADRSHQDLLTYVAKACAGEVHDGWTIVCGGYEVDVRPNDEGSEEARRAHPGDFLYFPFTVEIVTDGNPSEAASYIGFVGSLMKKLHAEKMKVVAACDWEHELPGGGCLGT